MRPRDERVRGRPEAGLGLEDEARGLGRRETRGGEKAGREQAFFDDG
jgi:hypothetical protein